MQVQHSQDIDTFVADQEIHTIGEVAKQRTMHAVVHTRKLSGVLDDATEHMSEFVKEPYSQTVSLVFIPKSCSLDIEFRLRGNDKMQSHPSSYRSRNLRSMSERTSVQDRPALGLAVYAAKRSRRIS